MKIADGLNNFFANIGPTLASDIGATNINFQTFLPESNSNSFRFSRVSEMDILYTCKQMKPKLSSGSDFISTKLLNEIAPLIITPSHYLINISLETGFVPTEMKLAKIVPVFKEGNCHEFTNYRLGFCIYTNYCININMDFVQATVQAIQCCILQMKFTKP